VKHVEHFAETNELCNVASCWLYLKINKVHVVTFQKRERLIPRNLTVLGETAIFGQHLMPKKCQTPTTDDNQSFTHAPPPPHLFEVHMRNGDRGSAVVKVLRYKS
jgi:hypothetical protein